LANGARYLASGSGCREFCRGALSLRREGRRGLAPITRYATRFAEALAAIDGTGAEPAARLAEYAGLYLQVLRQGRMCLCGMLAAEYQTLPQPMQDAVISFFDDNESWLKKVLEEGHRGGSLPFLGSARDTARLIIAGLEGAMLPPAPSATPAASRRPRPASSPPSLRRQNPNSGLPELFKQALRAAPGRRGQPAGAVLDAHSRCQLVLGDLDQDRCDGELEVGVPAGGQVGFGCFQDRDIDVGKLGE
jgi:hypothetical protein